MGGGRYTSSVIQRREPSSPLPGSLGSSHEPGDAPTPAVPSPGTGLPEPLKAGIERLSSVAMHDVSVHYRSSRPAALRALAYTRGLDIYLGPGQERHLPHEAWHVVQQKRGEVEPERFVGRTGLNASPALEADAERMGTRAQRLPAGVSAQQPIPQNLHQAACSPGVVQAFGNAQFDAFKALLQTEPDNTSSAELAERSSEKFGQLAYIVNAILSYSEVEKIPDVVKAITEGLSPGDVARVALVFGINAPESAQGDLDKAIAQARQLIAGTPFAIAIVRSTFSGNFPYGDMRNQVLHSDETRDLTRYFTSQGYHPYVSIQDFDTGSRAAGTDEGRHIFHVLDETLSGIGSGAQQMDDDTEPMPPDRPLMIAGGYRPQPQEKLVKDVMARVSESDKGAIGKKIEDQALAGFSETIAKDMRFRDMYARLDPLLPYAPEPNLFIDATAAARPSPVSGEPLEFGDNGAEYTLLAKRLAQYAADELEQYYGGVLSRMIEEIQTAQGRPLTNEEAEDVRADALAQLLVDAQNNRHPQRNVSFLTDFQNLTVGTDLSRLAHDALRGKASQDHTGLTNVIINRTFNERSDKSGTKLATIRDRFPKATKAEQEEYGRRFIHGSGYEAFEMESQNYFKKHNTMLGGLKRQRLSQALSIPFSGAGSFSGSYFGVDPAQKTFFTHQVAIQGARIGPEQLHESVLAEARRIHADEAFMIGYADGTDDNCLLISVFKAAGLQLNASEAQQLRTQLVEERLCAPVGYLDLNNPALAARLLELLRQRTGESFTLYSVHEVPASQGSTAYGVTPVAGDEGNLRKIYVFFAGVHFSPAFPRSPDMRNK
ncbi:DUF4157 domain-containing protein [Trinickia fusca]|uniref:DUF4157 domain-containing protein n=2 Tax=Trinickia fusca TaxID=2419777 RepID=A0A494XH19_9BURK|nr:DUF4157 domain-containing protein [Trinickia fusca]